MARPTTATTTLPPTPTTAGQCVGVPRRPPARPAVLEEALREAAFFAGKFGRAPELLTDSQVIARIDYGLTQEWTQRRIGEFAGRSATVVNRRKKERERAV
ncbi:hypothetical protein [Streptomyces sp. NPDC006668]|uniref:hypothetical protein n=1 Tax=Streptomyces sp. NPDC006668 TaxID=3156903 RepID=UPI0033DF0AD5